MPRHLIRPKQGGRGGRGGGGGGGFVKVHNQLLATTQLENFVKVRNQLLAARETRIGEGSQMPRHLIMEAKFSFFRNVYWER